MMKEVLIISKPVSPPWSDSGKNLIKGLLLHARGINFHILTNKGPAFGKENVVSEAIYRQGDKFNLSFLNKLRLLLRLLKPDKNIAIYHFFFTPQPLTSFFARLVIRLKKKKSLLTLCSSPKNYDSIKRLIFSDKTIVLSEYNRKKLIENGISNVIKINPGIELGDRDPDATDPEMIRVSNRLKGKRAVLFSGDYEFSQAHSTVLDCMPKVLERIPDLIFVFACRAKTKAMKDIEAYVKKQAEASGVSKSAIFLNEIANMRQLIRLCDLTILPAGSLYAKMDIPLVLIESMAESKPIIVSDIAPLNEIIINNAGIKVPAGDPKALAEAIVTLSTNEELRRKMGDACRKAAEAHYDIEKIAGIYSQLYERLG